MGVNKVIIVGNLGRDPEMRYLPSGVPVTNFSVAVSRKWKNRDGEQQEETEWFNVSCFDKLAEIANNFLVKGKQVFIEGRLKTDVSEGKDGQKRYFTKVIANELQMLGRKGDDDGERSETSEPEVPHFPF